ncbi:LuxE/PaaK family acyltransferase [Actinomadura rudentiformis]|uniref:Acyl-protein synthetase n=1 Tax=Actinomadura rudentiformis TaxID=359158 RepID=A0A6H9Z968_9ACTN|nr:acyl-protein synthetase [Actinomadura rudentiformis]KAB2351746.1 acyl-protein synthetase [Actinomadura rudentiformis]
MTVTAQDVFALAQQDKEERLLPQLVRLTRHHRAACPAYDRILKAIGHADGGGDGREYAAVAELPWLPVRMFKDHVLKSVPDDAVFRVLTSSGTTGAISRIHLDREAAATQARMLARTMRTVLGPRRLPMLIVDSRTTTRSSSARAAGVLGMANFGRDHTWILDEDDRPDLSALKGFLARHGDAPFLIFGFTFMVWRYLYEPARAAGLDLSRGVLVHSGGWKKLAAQAVDNADFRSCFAEHTGLTRIHNFYGMVEQIGTVFLEGPSGDSLYCPDIADVIVRDPTTWAETEPGVPGLLEVVSTLPRSYPGHVLLTEDLGVVHGIDDGDWPGKRFSVLGRLPRAEARGCSDTFAARPGGAAA